MLSGERTLLIWAAALIALSFVLRGALPRGLFIPIGSRFFHLNRIAFWLSLIAGLVIGMTGVVGALVRNRGTR